MKTPSLKNQATALKARGFTQQDLLLVQITARFKSIKRTVKRFASRRDVEAMQKGQQNWFTTLDPHYLPAVNIWETWGKHVTLKVLAQ
jgi:hypothetical protein